MAEENIEEQHFVDAQNIGEQHLSQIFEQQHFVDIQNIGEQHFGGIQNIGQQHFGDIQNVGEQHLDNTQIIEEPHLDDTQIIEEPHLGDTQIVDEQHLDDTQILEEQHLNDTQIVNEQHLDDIQDINEQHLGDTQNIEEQHPSDVQEMDNVPGDVHPPEDEKESDNNSAVVEEKKWPGWPGENVFRVLVPIQKVGGIIGRKGEFIKKMCEETKARIKILDGPPGITERAILISAKEEPNLLIPPALDGLLKIHKRIVELDSDPANPASGITVCTRLLVAASQAGSLIGKQGATVKSIQDDSHCTIRVLGGENLPVFALPDDSVVEVQGDPANSQKGVELIASHLRKFLVDRSVINVFEVQMQSPNARGNQGMPPPQSWRHPPSSFPMSPGAAGHGYDPFMAPPHQRPYDNYYQPDMPFEKPPRSGPPAYGSLMSGQGAHTSNVQQPPQAVIAKVTHNMQIQLSYADAVIGVKGANISYIRRVSGATIAIQEARGVPDQMTVEINGSASQVQAAQQLIQNAIAEAMSSMQQNASGGGGVPPPSQQVYNPYAQPHGTVYDASTGGHATAPSADYGSMYGGSTNYGGY